MQRPSAPGARGVPPKYRHLKAALAFRAPTSAERRANDQKELAVYVREAQQNEPTLIVGLSNISVEEGNQRQSIGRGLFASQPILKGHAMAEYRGYVYHTPEQIAEFHRKYGEEDEFVAPYAVRVALNGDIIDPSLDPSDEKHYSVAAFANDCLGSTSRYMKDIAHTATPCRSNNAMFDEKMGRVFLVATRNIDAGEEIYVNYGPSYWGSESMRLFKPIYSYLAEQYRIDPTRWFTAAEILVDVYPKFKLVWGKELRIKSLEQVGRRLRLSYNNGVFARTLVPVRQTPQQYQKYLQVRLLGGFFGKRPSEPIKSYQFRLAQAPYPRFEPQLPPLLLGDQLPQAPRKPKKRGIRGRKHPKK